MRDLDNNNDEEISASEFYRWLGTEIEDQRQNLRWEMDDGLNSFRNDMENMFTNINMGNAVTREDLRNAMPMILDTISRY